VDGDPGWGLLSASAGLAAGVGGVGGVCTVEAVLGAAGGGVVVEQGVEPFVVARYVRLALANRRARPLRTPNSSPVRRLRNGQANARVALPNRSYSSQARITQNEGAAVAGKKRPKSFIPTGKTSAAKPKRPKKTSRGK
jgi:hypothetical protein